MGRSADLPRRARTAGGRAATAAPGDDRGCGILHADMDAFYASVEIRERPELVGRPVAVSGGGNRGVVLSASYEAREFGVRSAMPVARARRLCPHAEFVVPHFDRYAEVSRQMLEIFRAITPLVEPLSLDEAFLDVSGALRRLGMGPAGVGEWLRAQVYDAARVTCSVGVAPNKFCAKLASGMAKPDGLLVVPAGGIREFLAPLPVAALWGVGERTGRALHALGCLDLADVAATPLSTLRHAVGAATAEHLRALAHGHDERDVVPDAAEKSLGAEETFGADVTERSVLHRELLRLSERTGSTLRRRGLTGRTVTLKLRFPDFSTATRSHTLAQPTDLGRTVFSVASALLADHLPVGTRVRLIGVRVEQLQRAGQAQQLSLDGADSAWHDAECASDAARSRFGTAAVLPATLLPH